MATHSPSLHDPNEAKRWLIIGAYHAGASENRIARISGLSKTAVRRIILNYQRTEVPSLPQELPRSVKEKPLVEYDEDGNLILDEEDEESLQVPGTSEHDVHGLHNKYFEKQQQRHHLPPKRSADGRITKFVPSKKISRLPTTKEIIAYVSQQRQLGNEATNSLATFEHSDDDIPSLSSVSSNPSTPLWRPLTPPRDSLASLDDKLMHLAPPMSVSLPPSPPLHSQHVPRLPPLSKYDQTIRGFEEWTHGDDMLLLEHVLERLEETRWKELEAKMEGRHTARLCKERWKYLQSILLKATTKLEIKQGDEHQPENQTSEEPDEEEIFELEDTDQEMEDAN